jgi:hypothetical protein
MTSSALSRRVAAIGVPLIAACVITGCTSSPGHYQAPPPATSPPPAEVVCGATLTSAVYVPLVTVSSSMATIPITLEAGQYAFRLAPGCSRGARYLLDPSGRVTVERAVHAQDGRIVAILVKRGKSTGDATLTVIPPSGKSVVIHLNVVAGIQ